VRWGSGEARIERVELLNASGEAVTATQTGQPVTLRFHYDAPQSVHNAVIGLAVNTISGVEVSGPNTRNSGLVCERLEGRGFVEFRIPRVLLVPGAYEIVAVIYDFTCTHAYDHVQRALVFDVESGVPFEENGVVSLGGEWSGASLRAIEEERRAG
jgi:ABC-2 type transport system ATP-binding protein